MEDNRIIKTSICLITLGMFITFPVFVSAYSPETTHAALTQEAVVFFNVHYKDIKLSDEELEIVISGSVSEDDGLRMLQHFYDPVYNRGLTIAKEWESSKEWAQDALAQAGIMDSMTAGTLKTFFSGEDDYSWERGIYEYAWGDKERGLESLGHTLHLLQDASVPDHTRNDAHPPLLHFGSPYEEWTDKFNRSNVDIAEKVNNKPPVSLSSLNDYFDSIADYSNNNFFSKDTIFSDEYKNPNISYEWEETLSNGKKYIFGYVNTGGNQYRAIRIKRDSETLRDKLDEYILEDYDNLILTDYWNLLSQQAVLHGTGVIKLFFDEVEKEKQTKALYNKNKNWFQKLFDSTQKDIYQTATTLYGGSVEYDELDDDAPSQTQQANVLSSTQNSAGASETERNAEDAEEETATEAVNDNTGRATSSIEEGVGDAVSVEPLNNESSVTPVAPLIYSDPSKPTPYQPGFGGGGGTRIDADETQISADETESGEENESQEESEEETATSTPATPTILSPEANFLSATTTVTFTGAASSTLIISNDFNSATTSSNVNEQWSLAISDIPEGETTFQFIATNENGATSTPTTHTVTVDTTAPVINSFTILECDYSLSQNACLSGGATLHLSWTSTSTDISYISLITDAATTATTTGTEGTITVAGIGTYSIQIALYDTAGNGATSTAKSVEVLTKTVVINEIAWAGTGASATDEWIELYNPSSQTIDLSNVSLSASDGAPDITLAGTIAASAYYLIERTASTTTSVAEDLAIAFSGSGGSGLSNSGEVLSLMHVIGGRATTTLDTTPALSGCSDAWCAGDNSTKQTMERISATSAGTLSSNWKSNNTFTKNGTDANGAALNGTPRAQNSVSTLSIGYFCPPETSSFTEGGYYTPSSGQCTYVYTNAAGTWYGDIYRGTVASSTIINGHSLGQSPSLQQNDDVTNPVQGEQLFAAVYLVRSGPAFDDLNEFRAFFKTGANPPSHLNYGIINWLYGVAP